LKRKSGQPAAARNLLISLAKLAHAKGFDRIAQQATGLL
jgi:hypothetical protein